MGMMLQLLGVSTVAFGLRNLRREFHRPSITENVLKGFTRVISSFMAPKPISAVMIKVLDDVTLTDAHVATTVGTEATIDERIVAIEENLTRLRAASQAKIDGVKQELAALEANIAKEADERQAADQATRDALGRVAVGGLHLEKVGLTWLVFGIVGTSVPDEIAALLWLF
jgi:hypothetical protein